MIKVCREIEEIDNRSLEQREKHYNREALKFCLRLVYVASPSDFRANALDRFTCTCHPFLKFENLDRKMTMTAIVAAASLDKVEDVLQ